MGIKTYSSTKLRVSLVSWGVFKVYCGNEGKAMAKNSFVLVCLGWLMYSRAVPGFAGKGWLGNFLLKVR